jgi:hypothetical protein
MAFKRPSRSLTREESAKYSYAMFITFYTLITVVVLTLVLHHFIMLPKGLAKTIITSEICLAFLYYFFLVKRMDKKRVENIKIAYREKVGEQTAFYFYWILFCFAPMYIFILIGILNSL